MNNFAESNRVIKRDRYLNKIISYMWDGQIKVITGIRRCGKSYLLDKLFRQYLLDQGVDSSHILSFALDLAKDIKYRNPLELAACVRNTVEHSTEQYYLFVDEIQMSDEVENPYNKNGKPITFYDALNDLKTLPNLDIYVTGSNSKMLSSDILTEFRGRSDEIRVHPLSFSEYYSAIGGDKTEAFDDYCFYGGMPLILSRPTESDKRNYLSRLFSEVYLKDIVADLMKYGTVTVMEDMCIICVVGDLSQESIGFASQAAQALKEIPVQMISYGGSCHNISFLVKEDDKKRALQALSDTLFNSQD